ncbi:DUF4956 domain-containing protein [Desulfopila inferna]|mgnify:CR=1 FL=1|uniref:DUF4956 domain-containing protein n=1 Tax=Desulfopila inferna TaxID=468528 RepID=UPI001965DEA4|nr:DUF4956 domain-containing protein [Desulfopila inferna]MBM9603738.1 DUF4956 domain-containing protein [Desulfopila inferna]
MESGLLDFIGGFGNKEITDIGLWPLSGLLLISLISAFIVSYLYVHFFKQRSTGSQIHRAFPLLGISITAIFICIQFSLPLSLGLLGALSIVRFRTPIKEPEEIGFLMLLVATSISCATFNLAFLAIILLTATLGLFLARFGGVLVDSYLSSGMITCTLPGDSSASLDGIMETIISRVAGARIDSISESGEYAVVSTSFHKLPGAELVQLKSALAALDKRVKIDVFYHNQTS